ncbi:MAG: hypothetical protein IKP75_08355 [Oscillospiraceae bacterium]|nr:hypothetical protein [Oscillospiraceae bacterium]
MLISVLGGVMCGGAVTKRDSMRRDLPRWAVFAKQDGMYDICGENVRVTLCDGELEISSDTVEYISHEEWFVADCIICDIDHDGLDNVLLHVWKKGSYGEYQPFWEEDDKDEFSEHLFIYQWDKERASRLRPIWMSSRMPVTGKKVEADDRGVISVTSTDNTVSRWYWGTWGLVRLDESSTYSQTV